MDATELALKYLEDKVSGNYKGNLGGWLIKKFPDEDPEVRNSMRIKINSAVNSSIIVIK